MQIWSSESCEHLCVRELSADGRCFAFVIRTRLYWTHVSKVWIVALQSVLIDSQECSTLFYTTVFVLVPML